MPISHRDKHFSIAMFSKFLLERAGLSVCQLNYRRFTMKKTILATMAVFAIVGLAGCDYYLDSAEQKAFKEFVAKCKKDPTTEDCKAWRESQNSPGGGDTGK